MEVGYNCDARPPSQEFQWADASRGYTRQCQRYDLDIFLSLHAFKFRLLHNSEYVTFLQVRAQRKQRCKP